MLGAIIGDMVGSVYEFHPYKNKKFNIYNKLNRLTDDSYLTLAVEKVLKNHMPIDYSDEGLEKIKNDLIKEFVKTVNIHENAGFGGMFYRWAKSIDHSPYNSYGNGSAMRISPVGWVATSIDEVRKLSRAVTEITHNHPDGIKGAEAVAMCIFLARNGKTKDEIKDYVLENYYPEIADLNYDQLVEDYYFSEICEKSVPQAIYCFLISDSLEDAIRNCISIGGDCDTTAAMAGAIAESYYQKEELSLFEKEFIYYCIDPEVINQLKDFYKNINNKKLESIR